MISFPFLDQLFDETQYRIIAIRIICSHYDEISFPDGTEAGLWQDMDDPECRQVASPYTDPIPFCNSFQPCKEQLMAELINYLYQEKVNVKRQLEVEIFKNPKAEDKLLSFTNQKLKSYIIQIPNKEWLKDKPQILEELERFRSAVIALSNNNIDINNDKLVWHGKIGHLGSVFKELVDKGYLKESPGRLRDFIVANFVDDRNNKIEPLSVYKTLTPGGRLSKTFDNTGIPPSEED